MRTHNSPAVADLEQMRGLTGKDRPDHFDLPLEHFRNNDINISQRLLNHLILTGARTIGDLYHVDRGFFNLRRQFGERTGAELDALLEKTGTLLFDDLKDPAMVEKKLAIATPYWADPAHLYEFPTEEVMARKRREYATSIEDMIGKSGQDHLVMENHRALTPEQRTALEEAGIEITHALVFRKKEGHDPHPETQ